MKRYISLSLAAVILVFSMAVPSYAADTGSDVFFNVLDLATPNGGDDYYENAYSGSPVEFDWGNYLPVCYVDILCVITGNIPSAVSIDTTYFPGSVNLTIDQIDSCVYRIYGSTGGNYLANYLDLTFYSSGVSYVTFLKFDICSAFPFSFDIEAFCDISASDYEDTIHYIPTDDYNYRIIHSTDVFDETHFSCYIWSDDWRKYDYLEFQLLLDVLSITSVTASFESMNVPFDVSYISSDSLDGNYYYVSIRMDLRSLDRTSTEYPFIVLMGRLELDTLNGISFSSASGFVEVNNFDPVTYFLRNIFTSIKNGFSGLSSWISNQTSAITGSISSWGQKIVDAFSPDDDGSADEFQDSVSQQAGELSGIADAMGSLDKPDPDSMDINLDSFAVNANISGVGSVLAIPMNNEILLQVLIMTFTFALVGYGLFGKR